jgi:hypothetical protein
MAATDRKRSSDLRNALDRHLQTLAPEAPLRGVIASKAVEQRIAEFDRADAIAMRKQRSGRRTRALVLWAGLIGALVPGLVLLPMEEWFPHWSSQVRILSILSVMLTTFAIVWIGLGRSEYHWRRFRAEAESIRGDVFRAIMRAGAATQGLLAPALTCFKKAHLDWQLSYFRRRGDEYAEAANQTIPFRLVGYLLWAASALLGLVAVANLAASLGFPLTYLSPALEWLVVPQSERWQMGFSAMASSILAFASARTSVDRDVPNAPYYYLAAAMLSELSDGISEAEAAAADGRTADVMAYCERVQSILTVEQQTWLSGRAPDPAAAASGKEREPGVLQPAAPPAQPAGGS